MKMIKNFDDYLLDLLVETIDKSTLIFSDRFLKLINVIQHPISEYIQNTSNDDGYKITYIDLDDSGIDKVSFITSVKAREIILGKKQSDEYISDTRYKDIKNYNNDIYDRLMNTNRSITTIGKLINKLYPNRFKSGGSPGEDIESFVKIFKSLREPKKMELVSGEDIVKYYNVDEYLYDNKGELGKSCMRHEECGEYIEFYEENSHIVSLLVMFDKNEDDEDKVIGRALVWKLSDPEGRYFMDRVYTAFNHNTEQFIQYAKENNWLYKKNQSSSPDENIIDPMTNKEENILLLIKNVNDHSFYPYMDTFRYYSNYYGKLTNDESYFSGDYYILNDTEGGYEDKPTGEWSDYYDDYIDPEDSWVVWCEYGEEYRYQNDAVYLDFYGEWATEDYAENYLVDCDYYGGSSSYREESDTVEIYYTNEIACKEYASDNLVYSEYLGEYLPEYKDVWSEYHNSYMYEPETTEVYTDVSQKNTDYRSEDEDDGDWWEWDYDRGKYDNSITEEELIEYHNLEDGE